MAVLMASGIFALFLPGRWWMCALAVGLWIPLAGIIQTQNYSSLIALGVAFVGALSGMLVRVGVFGKPAPTPSHQPEWS